MALDDSNPPFYRWFTDGTLNLSYNCLDRHLEGGETRSPTTGWANPAGAVTSPTGICTVRCADSPTPSLRSEWRHGDRVAVYMGMVPELPVAMLACARIGAVHSVVFGGFSSDARRPDRRRSSQGAGHPGRCLARRERRPAQGQRRCRLARTPSIEHVVVLRRVGSEVAMKEGRDLWWDEIVDGQPDTFPSRPRWVPRRCSTSSTPRGRPASQGDSPHPGRLPGGVATTHHYVFDLKPDDVYLVRR